MIAVLKINANTYRKLGRWSDITVRSTSRKEKAMADIRFLPVCSNCGTILKYREIEVYEEEFGRIDGYLFTANNGKISPDQCPICGIIFDKIIMPTRLPFYYKGADE